MKKLLIISLLLIVVTTFCSCSFIMDNLGLSKQPTSNDKNNEQALPDEEPGDGEPDGGIEEDNEPTVPEDKECVHIYDNACDVNCNECGDIREVEDHLYDNACDIYCNECGKVRNVPNHVFDNACDVDCNECGEIRNTTHHYENACDTECNECGDIREVEDHVYDNACDSNCNECGEIRELESNHYYDNACDANCNECGSVRKTDGHVVDGACDVECNVCGIKVGATANHTYDNECVDVDCNVCGEIRVPTGSHSYDNACDTECSECGYVRIVEGHEYNNKCDPDCNICGAGREVGEHQYKDGVCTECGEVNPNATATYVRATADVNVRAGNSTDYPVIGVLQKGDMVRYDGEDDGWYVTVYKDQVAYVSMKYSEKVEMQKASDVIEKVIDCGCEKLGMVYVYGAIRLHDGDGIINSNFDDTEFDCSSLMQYIYFYGADVILDVTTRTQSVQGVAVDREDVQRGDLMFFTNADRVDNTGIERIGHVAMYLGDGYILHTASDHAVIEKISEVRESYFICARRVVE